MAYNNWTFLSSRASEFLFNIVYVITLEIRVSQNLAKLGGGGGGEGGGEAHKMSGMEGGENWSQLGSLAGRVSAFALILDGVNFNPVLFY